MALLNGAVHSVNAAALLLGAAGLLSRALGVVRDRLLAGHFGAGSELDAYYAAFQIPDFMSIVFLLGAGSAAILPIFQENLLRDRREAHRLISHLTVIFLAGSIVISAIAFLFAPLLMRIVAPGFSEENQRIASLLTRIMLVSPILLGLSSIFSSVIQSFQRFLVYALAPVLYNIGIIVGVVVLVPLWGTVGLAGGVILGALLHLLAQFYSVMRLGFAPHLGEHLQDLFQSWRSTVFSGTVKNVLRIAFPRVLSVSTTHITILILVALGSTLAEGSIAVFQLARNLFFVPVGIFGVSYAIAVFPSISRSYLERKGEDFFGHLFMGIRSILFWIVPSAVLFLVLRAHIVRAALGAGEFSWEDTRLAAALLAAFTLAMLAEALGTLLIKGYYALGNTWIPFVINVVASLFSVGLSFFLVTLLRAPSEFSTAVVTLFRISDLPHPEVLGLALGFSIGLALNIFVLYKKLRVLSEKTFGIRERFPARVVLEILVSALLGGGVAYAVRVSFSETLPLITFMQVLGQGVLAGLAGFAVYFGTLFLMKNEDVYSLAGALRRRLFKVRFLPRHWDGETHLPHQP